MRLGSNRRSTSQRGAALVEMTVAMPVLLLVLVGAADFGRIFFSALAVTQAARAGAEFGAYSDANSSNADNIRAAALAAVASDLAVTITFPTAGGDARTCECATDAGAFTTTSCASPTCGAGEHLIKAVTVTASFSFSAIAPYPGIPRPVVISRTMKMRLE
jgi:Flp pilus assembly protein TadG